MTRATVQSHSFLDRVPDIQGSTRQQNDAAEKAMGSVQFGAKCTVAHSPTPRKSSCGRLMCSVHLHRTPKQLFNDVFFFAGKHFALRSGGDHRSLRASEHGLMSISTNLLSGWRSVRVRAFSKPCQSGQLLCQPARAVFVQMYFMKDRSDAFYLKPSQTPMSSDPAYGHPWTQHPEGYVLNNVPVGRP